MEMHLVVGFPSGGGGDGFSVHLRTVCRVRSTAKGARRSRAHTRYRRWWYAGRGGHVDRHAPTTWLCGARAVPLYTYTRTYANIVLNARRATAGPSCHHPPGLSRSAAVAVASPEELFPIAVRPFASARARTSRLLPTLLPQPTRSFHLLPLYYMSPPPPP